MMNKAFRKLLIFSSQFFAWGLPVLAFAQRSGGIRDWILSFRHIVNLLIPLTAALALLFFFYGLAKFVFKLGNGDESAVEEGKEIMKWGIVALFVMVSIWGIVSWIRNDLRIPDIKNISTPNLR